MSELDRLKQLVIATKMRHKAELQELTRKVRAEAMRVRRRNQKPVTDFEPDDPLEGYEVDVTETTLQPEDTKPIPKVPW